jgi:hypothetical protein
VRTSGTFPSHARALNKIFRTEILLFVQTVMFIAFLNFDFGIRYLIKVGRICPAASRKSWLLDPEEHQLWRATDAAVQLILIHVGIIFTLKHRFV